MSELTLNVDEAEMLDAGRDPYVDSYLEAFSELPQAWAQLGYSWATLRTDCEALMADGVPAVLALLNLGVSAETLFSLEALGRQREQFVVVDPFAIDISLFDRFSISRAKSEQVCPYALEDGVLHAVSADPFRLNQQRSLLRAAFPQSDPVIHLTMPVALETALNGAAARLARENVAEISGRFSEARPDISDGGGIEVSSSEEQRLAREIITEGLRARASDVHLDPVAQGVEIRYRIDGMIVRESILPPDLAIRVINHIKVESDLDIVKNLPPQDGRYSLWVDGVKKNFRVATLPTVYDMDKLTLRLSTTEEAVIPLEGLGFEARLLSEYRRLLSSSWGLVLVAGPVGAGKTHTLYSSVQFLNDGTKEILSLEDPVETIIDGVVQIGVREPRITFASSLRHLVRNDPNVVVIGEIRDAATAATAAESAIAGRLVLSTLHTKDAVSAVRRMRDIGVEAYQIAEGLRGVLAQRLLRMLCDCKVADPANAETRAFWENLGRAPEATYRPAGCALCHRTGYRGRIAVGELLVVDDDISEAISQELPRTQLLAGAVEKGMETMRDNALTLVAEGKTSLQEVQRVLGAS